MLSKDYYAWQIFEYLRSPEFYTALGIGVICRLSIHYHILSLSRIEMIGVFLGTVFSYLAKRLSVWIASNPFAPQVQIGTWLLTYGGFYLSRDPSFAPIFLLCFLNQSINSLIGSLYALRQAHLRSDYTFSTMHIGVFLLRYPMIAFVLYQEYLPGMPSEHWEVNFTMAVGISVFTQLIFIGHALLHWLLASNHSSTDSLQPADFSQPSSIYLDSEILPTVVPISSLLKRKEFSIARDSQGKVQPQSSTQKKAEGSR